MKKSNMGINTYLLGKGPATKSDEFLEKFQTAFDPPPHFWKNMLQIFFIIGCFYARRHSMDMDIDMDMDMDMDMAGLTVCPAQQLG